MCVSAHIAHLKAILDEKSPHTRNISINKSLNSIAYEKSKVYIYILDLDVVNFVRVETAKRE